MEQITCFLLEHLILENGQNMKAYLSSNLAEDKNIAYLMTKVSKLSHINQPSQQFTFKINIQFKNSLAYLTFEQIDDIPRNMGSPRQTIPEKVYLSEKHNQNANRMR